MSCHSHRWSNHTREVTNTFQAIIHLCTVHCIPARDLFCLLTIYVGSSPAIVIRVVVGECENVKNLRVAPEVILVV
jgi:hypothetical protein